MALRDFFYIQAYISVSVCIISISVANLTEAGKVNKTKRSPNEEETTPQNSTAESPSDSWQDLELPMHTWMMVLSGVIAFWFFLSCFLAFCCGPKFVECHLCEKPIPNKQWNKHDHWDTCAKDHERFLNELPDTDYRCPTCTRPLKLWPKGIGPKVFKCQIGQECDPELLKDPQSGLNLEKQLHTRSKLIDNLNTGESRYSCYEDGFDVCNRCADEVMSARPTRTPSTLNNTRSSVASSSKKELNGGWFDVQLKTISHHVAEKENAAKVKVNGKVIVVQNEA